MGMPPRGTPNRRDWQAIKGLPDIVSRGDIELRVVRLTDVEPFGEHGCVSIKISPNHDLYRNAISLVVPGSAPFVPPFPQVIISLKRFRKTSWQ